MPDCIFCKIVAGQIPSSKVYEDDDVLAFRDIAPQAKQHLLVIPKVHVGSLSGTAGWEDAHLGHLLKVAVQVARQEGLADTGYRLVTNCGAHACQSVDHLHFHLLGGQQLEGRMG